MNEDLVLKMFSEMTDKGEEIADQIAETANRNKTLVISLLCAIIDATFLRCGLDENEMWDMIYETHRNVNDSEGDYTED